MDKIQLGKFGEQYAENFLLSQNYLTIAKNYRCRFGEIDIIAVDNSNRQLVFVEVKTRRSNLFGEPGEAVDYKKKVKILKTALHFLGTARQKLHAVWRGDVIAVKLDRQYRLREIQHFKNIFDG